jgi:hypothetical protein
VRGTTFEFDTVTLRVEEGRVRYSGEGSERVVSVRQGETSRVDEVSGRAVAPTEITVSELAPAPPAAAVNSGMTAPQGVPRGLKVSIEWE